VLDGRFHSQASPGFWQTPGQMQSSGIRKYLSQGLQPPIHRRCRERV